MSEEMEGQVIHREFAVDLEASGDGRTLDVRIVPYNVVQRVVDPVHLGGTGIPYNEAWLPGAFEKQRDAAHRLLVNFEHQEGVGGVVGRGLEFRDSDEALEASVRMLSQQDADKALELVNEGVLGGVSLEAKPLKSVRRGDVVQRVKAHLENIALCRRPAFEGAEVLAVREAPEEEEQEVVFYERNSAVDERLARMGFASLASRKTSSAPWDPTRERFTDEQWAASCLTDEKLPVLEPDGSISVEALQRATKQVTAGSVTVPDKGAVARKLIRYYNAASLEAPDYLRYLARSL